MIQNVYFYGNLVRFHCCTKFVCVSVLPFISSVAHCSLLWYAGSLFTMIRCCCEFFCSLSLHQVWCVSVFSRGGWTRLCASIIFAPKKAINGKQNVECSETRPRHITLKRGKQLKYRPKIDATRELRESS